MALTSKQRRELQNAPVPVHGNKVALAIALLDLTQAEVADEIELTQPYVSDVARGRHTTITLDNARKFADFFGCTIEDIFPPKVEA